MDEKNSLTSVWKWYSCWAVPQRNLQKQFSDHIFLTSGSNSCLSFTHIRVVVSDEYSVLFEGREDMNGPYIKLDEVCVCLFNGSAVFILSKEQSKQNIHGTCSCLCYFFRKRWASIECVNAVCWFSIEFSLVLCWFLFHLFWPIRLLYNIALFWTCFTNRVIINALHVWLFFSVPLLFRVVQFDCYFD